MASKLLKLAVSCWALFFLPAGIHTVWATPTLGGMEAWSAGGLRGWTSTGGAVSAGSINCVDFRYATPAAAPVSPSLYFYRSIGQRELTYAVAANPPASADSRSATSFPADPAFRDDDEGFGPEAMFPTDLQDVERIAFYVTDKSSIAAEQSTDVDNGNIPIPEPEDIFVLATVLLAMGLSFRHRFCGTARTCPIGPS